jgi:hypothetical protein
MVCDCEEKKERRGFWTLFVTASFFVGLWFCRGWIDSFEFCFGFLTVRWCVILVDYISWRWWNDLFSNSYAYKSISLSYLVFKKLRILEFFKSIKFFI